MACLQICKEASLQKEDVVSKHIAKGNMAIPVLAHPTTLKAV
jgi:hypothetical protein